MGSGWAVGGADDFVGWFGSVQGRLVEGNGYGGGRSVAFGWVVSGGRVWVGAAWRPDGGGGRLAVGPAVGSFGQRRRWVGFKDVGLAVGRSRQATRPGGFGWRTTWPTVRERLGGQWLVGAWTLFPLRMNLET